jgi:DNA-binding response OmpR family regulator
MEQIVNPSLDFLPNVPISMVQRRLLSKLLAAEGNVVAHDELLELWPKTRSKTALEMAVFNLRRKIDKSGYDIISHRGLGYSLASKKRRKKSP